MNQRDFKVLMARLGTMDDSPISMESFGSSAIRKVRKEVHAAARLLSGVFFKTLWEEEGPEEYDKVMNSAVTVCEVLLARMITDVNEMSQKEVAASEEKLKMLYTVVKAANLKKIAADFVEQNGRELIERIVRTRVKIPADARSITEGEHMPLTDVDPQYILVVPKYPDYMAKIKADELTPVGLAMIEHMSKTWMKGVDPTTNLSEEEQEEDARVEVSAMIGLSWLFVFMFQALLFGAIAKSSPNMLEAVSDLEISFQKGIDAFALAIEHEVARVLFDVIPKSIKEVLKTHPEWKKDLTRFILVGQIEGLIDPKEMPEPTSEQEGTKG